MQSKPKFQGRSITLEETALFLHDLARELSSFQDPVLWLQSQDSVFRVDSSPIPPSLPKRPAPSVHAPSSMTTAGRQSSESSSLPPRLPNPHPLAQQSHLPSLPAPDLSFVAFAGTSFAEPLPPQRLANCIAADAATPSNRNPVPKQISIISSDASSQSDIGDAETRHPLEAPVHQATAFADESAGAPPFENLDSMESKSIQVMARSLNKGISRAMLAPYLYPKTQTSQYPILHGARTSSLDCSGQTNALSYLTSPPFHVTHGCESLEKKCISSFLLPHASQNDNGSPTRTSPEQTRLDSEKIPQARMEKPAPAKKQSTPRVLRSYRKSHSILIGHQPTPSLSQIQFAQNQIKSSSLLHSQKDTHHVHSEQTFTSNSRLVKLSGCNDPLLVSRAHPIFPMDPDCERSENRAKVIRHKNQLVISNHIPAWPEPSEGSPTSSIGTAHARESMTSCAEERLIGFRKKIATLEKNNQTSKAKPETTQIVEVSSPQLWNRKREKPMRRTPRVKPRRTRQVSTSRLRIAA